MLNSINPVFVMTTMPDDLPDFVETSSDHKDDKVHKYDAIRCHVLSLKILLEMHDKS